MLDRTKNKERVSRRSLLIVVTMMTATAAISAGLLNSHAYFSDEAQVGVEARAATLESAQGLIVRAIRFNETDLSWQRSNSDYAQGYKIYRSKSKYGPWSEIATIPNPETLNYIDTTGGVTTWVYRVEAFAYSWISTSEGFEAPPPIGSYFFDSFEGPKRSLDGQPTQDGSSIWQVWHGDLRYNGEGRLNDHTTDGTPSVAVVRTPAQNGVIFMADMDGSERFVFRGKDPQNYIYAGGIAGNGFQSASFEIAEMRNGVRNVLWSGSTGSENIDMRLVVNGNHISIYRNAVNGDNDSGSLFTEATSNYLIGDSGATYFGFGFASDDFGITDYTFQALE